MKREGDIIAVGKNITRKKGMRKQENRVLIKAVGKNIKWGRGEVDGNFV